MKIVGIFGAHQANGLTKQMLTALWSGIPAEDEVTTIDLNQVEIRPDIPNKANLVLDKIEQALKESDIWVIAAPTYWGGLSGEMKHFFDCLRPRIVRFDQRGGMHPGRYADKHYVTLTNCYATKWTNLTDGITNATFNQVDKVMTTAGLHKAGEVVLTDTWELTELPAKKADQLKQLGHKLGQLQRKDDETMKRYLLLFAVVAIMTLITMSLQSLISWFFQWQAGFWGNYIVFICIFFAMLAISLHLLTVSLHARK